jgi:hypothetical protein
MTNVTISNNSAGSAVNAGGIHKATSNLNAFLRNNIIAGNTSGSASTDATGVFNSNGNNLIGVSGTSSGWVGSDLLDQMALLSPLGDNGGMSPTHLPMAGSPAINAGDNCVVDLSCGTDNPPFALTTDQRGFTRPVEKIVDIGAVEVAPMIVMVSGRVLAASGLGVSGAVVTLSDGGMNSYVTRTNGFGYYTFSEVLTGSGYTLGAFAKGRFFGSQMISISGNTSGLDISEELPLGPVFRNRSKNP